MIKILNRINVLAAAVVLLVISGGCNTVDDDRIPSLAVNINLSTPDLWTVYGVSGYGDYNSFIYALGQPRNFAYTVGSCTGFGGVLLVSGFNPFTLEASVPMAYDLACPVERKPDVRVRMVAGELLPYAVCPECGSKYDVVERAGAPVSGPALSHHFGLARYDCLPSAYGGYIIINR